MSSSGNTKVSRQRSPWKIIFLWNTGAWEHPCAKLQKLCVDWFVEGHEQQFAWWLLGGLKFEPKDDSNIYLHWEGLLLNNRWCEGSTQDVSPVPHRAQWVLCCRRGWLLPGPAAQLSASRFHGSSSAHGWLRLVPLRLKAEMFSNQADCLVTAFLVLQSGGRESGEMLLLLNRLL